MKFLRILSLALVAASCSAADLTGNWAIKKPLADGTYNWAYFNLKQDGDKISGTIRTTQFYYTITESTNGPDGYNVTASMMDGKSPRGVKFDVKLVGDDELHITSYRRNNEKSEDVAHRAPAGEGAMPARVEPPALHKVSDNGLARTPPMGWNSWNKFGHSIDDAAVRGVADAMVKSGMRDAGYVYINIDDTWEAGRDAQGNIQTNKKFPDMKALADYVHSKGLKLGIYSSPGPNTCAGYEGSYGHEEQDAKTYSAWGIDYLKYDWCGARILYKDEEMQAVYQKMGDALLATGRPIVYSLCQYGRNDVWKWGADVGGNLWRTTGDIRDTWESMQHIGFSQDEHAPYAKPGHWNDPDMLEIGNGHMTDTEYRTHMSLWSMLSAPLIAGNDLRDMTPAIHDILTNREVIAIDQDMAGKQATRAWRSEENKMDDQQIWVKQLADGGQAIALLNRSDKDAKITVKWADLGIKATPKHVRDLWEHKDVKLDKKSTEYSTTVPGHGVVLLRIK
jgi:alpha-galactosidase